MSKLAVIFAEGFEEIEAISVVDILRRAQVTVDMLGVGALSITGSHGIEVAVDKLLSAVKAADYDGVVLPGGLPGSFVLRDDTLVQEFIIACKGKLQAAICAAPIALKQAGSLDGRLLTSHPSMESEFDSKYYLEKNVVIDGKVVTSRGAGTSFDFVAGILEVLGIESKVHELRQAMLYPK
ncbi:DJ-1/PfpI family protein [Lentisphaera marina]|uniref:DJ-1 family glyoxalase III n=1 Tax=Lentisphaera marina TaxID=1111041 RepID=UPI0023657CCE|nr:DJ-1 family glyoxalase III [Lentisphaera marina]MDD7985774.1 DJ-1/PfpI family protein [Lentisphaera marina]